MRKSSNRIIASAAAQNLDNTEWQMYDKRDKEECMVCRKYEFWPYHYPVVMESS